MMSLQQAEREMTTSPYKAYDFYPEISDLSIEAKAELLDLFNSICILMVWPILIRIF